MRLNYSFLRKQKKNNQKSTIVKIGDNNPYERYVYAGQDCLVHNSR